MEIELGIWVICLADFVDVPEGTKGMIVEDYGSGITVAWDKPDRPIGKMSPRQIAAMPAVDPRCPLRDGFSNEELEFLDRI